MFTSRSATPTARRRYSTWTRKYSPGTSRPSPHGCLSRPALGTSWIWAAGPGRYLRTAHALPRGEGDGRRRLGRPSATTAREGQGGRCGRPGAHRAGGPRRGMAGAWRARTGVGIGLHAPHGRSRPHFAAGPRNPRVRRVVRRGGASAAASPRRFQPKISPLSTSCSTPKVPTASCAATTSRYAPSAPCGPHAAPEPRDPAASPRAH
jgi:hypothetical protein